MGDLVHCFASHEAERCVQVIYSDHLRGYVPVAHIFAPEVTLLLPPHKGSCAFRHRARRIGSSFGSMLLILQGMLQHPLLRRLVTRKRRPIRRGNSRIRAGKMPARC